ncbi:bifunctional 2-polyprenyl-6-hydroxyphenol methylase/3-demethylubiquinol 3-O-methyltransferase UbiG [Pedobacter sp. MC2016-24]|uniref:class I SAM-dependent methyltransferase n=1 Tax=Pedobacter sp. MC2016-24 TaxID=2780090 RepID=UPI0018812F0F|nr:class I SAM-dependent methyltransferase [Pedobacter sp. MC2016-24]MBE9601785.1 class I SAM-dependent methyltransferase [Pedobacter sp. MC2016-24]
MQRKWFQYWFNSPYYHILYSQRNDAEAEFLIDNLSAYLKPAAHSKILDIACGRGRHSIYLNKKGYDVTGIDLSEQSIKFAQQFEQKHLHFYVHDMRKLCYINYFDIAMNLFTSFGYFDTEKDHVNALKSFRKSIKDDGTVVIDYFNTEKILKNLTHKETKVVDGIEFHLNKFVSEGKIIKHINFEHRDKSFAFEERVQAFSRADFERMLEKSGLRIEAMFGSYGLEPFDEIKSDRLILICKKV